MELMVVIGIIVLLTAIVATAIPSLMKSNQIDQSVTTISGVMEQAREAAISGNTYVWVAFSSPTTSNPANGIWAAIIQSSDGTESPINTTVTPAWVTTNITIPSSNLLLLSKLQNLPGVQIVDVSSLPATTSNAATSAGAPTNSITTLWETTTQWTVTPAQFTEGYTSSTYFTKVVEFTPDGEAHTGATTWYNAIQFGLTPSTGSNTKNSVFINLSRTTGKLTVYRP